MRGHLIEGRQWLEAVLAKTEGPPAMRAKVLANASWIAWEQLDYDGSAALSQEGLALARESGDQAGRQSQHTMGTEYHGGPYSERAKGWAVNRTTRMEGS